MHPIEQLVRDKLPLHNRPTASGWYPLLCKVCSSNIRKGARAGVLFDGCSVKYNCFNCGAKFTYTLGTARVSREFKRIMSCYNTTDDDIGLALIDTAASMKMEDLISNVPLIGKRPAPTTPVDPPTIPLPKSFKMLEGECSPIADQARRYLTDERRIDPNSYPFLIAAHSNESWRDRLIIPIFKGNNLIHYSGRDLTGLKPAKYKKCDYSTEHVLFGFEELEGRGPLYVYEGIFDALLIPGVAVLGNRMSKGQINWLNRSPRQKVIVPDRWGNGGVLAEQGLDLGWSVSLPDIGDSAKDITDAVREYGKIYVLKSMIDNTYSGFEGMAKMRMLCK